MLEAGKVFDFRRNGCSSSAEYAIFSSDRAQAYKQIALLAETLYRNHGLSLQPQKTSISNADDFISTFLTTPLDREIDSLHDKFSGLLDELGLESWYEPIEYEDLSDEQQELVDTLNLVDLLKEEAEANEPDMPVIRFCLRRLGQLGDDNAVSCIFENLESIAPAFVDVIQYISKLRYLDSASRSTLGGKLLNLLEDSMVSELAYHRMWIMKIFTESREWDNENKFVNLYNRETDQVCKRKLILAMGRAQQTHWFQSQWRSLFEHPHWQRRAVLVASSCMPADARKHWYRSIDSQLDILERAVVRWARANPFIS